MYLIFSIKVLNVIKIRRACGLAVLMAVVSDKYIEFLKINGTYKLFKSEFIDCSNT